MEENQNTNDQSQPEELPATKVNETSESIPSPTTIPEIKEETPTPPTQHQTSNIEPQSDSMEVHKHPHHVTHKKKWPEYLLEFFMLFLAVFLGFVAENVRETIVERARGKEYIESFAEDLQKDLQQLNRILPLVKERKTRLDSLNFYLHNFNGYTAELYYYARHSTRPSSFTANDRTILQLKNSGGFRLITNRASADSIMRYQASLERYQYSLLRDDQEVEHLHPYLAKLFDAVIFEAMIDSENIIHKPRGNPSLRLTDPSLINEFSYYVHQLTTTTFIEIQGLQKIQIRATNILKFLQQKYHLKMSE